MINTKKSGFTLIELVVSISIVFLLSLMVFAPYGFYLKKSKVKHTDKEVSQAIYNAKNMAINGSAVAAGNVSIGIYFDSTGENKYSYKILSFPHDINTTIMDPENGVLMEEFKLQQGIELGKFQGEEKGIIFFRSITGSGTVITWDGEVRSEIEKDEQNEITLEYSYKGASYGLLHGDLQYFQDTQIVDY